MTTNATTTNDSVGQTTEQRDCERCGRDRPASPRRFAIIASDFTDATADFEKALLCGECWRAVRDQLREVGR